MVEGHILDITFEERLRERYASLDEALKEKLKNYGRRILDVQEPNARGILLDHLEGVYEMAGKEDEQTQSEYRHATRFLDNVLGSIETRRQEEELRRRVAQIAQHHLATGGSGIQN